MSTGVKLVGNRLVGDTGDNGREKELVVEAETVDGTSEYDGITEGANDVGTFVLALFTEIRCGCRWFFKPAGSSERPCCCDKTMQKSNAKMTAFSPLPETRDPIVI